MKTPLPILHITQKENKEEDSTHNFPQLFKPLPIKIGKNENNLKHSNSNIPIIYPRFQYGSISTLNYNSPSQMPNLIFYEKNINKKILDSKVKPCCSCIKTKCVKKYCECFSNNKICTNCLCLDCKNKDLYTASQNKENVQNNNIKEKVFCTCSKSGCNKKYCECYKEGLKCNIKCRCVKCLNCEENCNKISNSEQIINLDETRCESGKKSLLGEINDFNVEKISIFIEKNKTFINIEKMNREDFVLLCKKRKSG